MKGVLILIAIFGLATSWLFGYEEGERTGAFRLVRETGEDVATIEAAGMDKGRDQVCDEIRDYKFSVAKDLDENTQICGWTDMDEPRNSN